MKAFFAIIGVILTFCVLIFVLIFLIDKYLIKWIKYVYYRFIYQNYEIWFSYKRMNKEECIKWLKAYDYHLKNGNVSELDRNTRRFKKSVSKRLNDLSQ